MASIFSSGGQSTAQQPGPQPDYIDDSIDLRDLFWRVARGLYQILGLTLLLAAAGLVIALVASRLKPTITTTRISFSFPGFERGQYPDKSRFQPDDLRTPVIIDEAVRRLGFEADGGFQGQIRGALSIEGIVPPSIVKERDRLRAAGQTPPAYIPDEYVLSLTLKPDTRFPPAQRERLLAEIVTVYRENFQRTYSQPPIAFGTAFDTLKNADFSEYELVLNSEVDLIRAYLGEQMDLAKSYRSPTTNFSFKDLMEQTERFAQIQLNEVLGIIRENGLSRNRANAMMKMNYYLRLLDERERKAMEEEKVVRDLLAQAQARTQNYVLGIKSQAAQPRADSTVLDQGLIDSLLANDSYNLLVRKALDAGFQVKRIEAEKNRLIAQRDNMQSFLNASAADQSATIEQAAKALVTLESVYHTLIANIRKTHADFTRQEYGHAIRLSDEIRTPGIRRSLLLAAGVGAFLGFALGAGLSLLGVYVGRRTLA